MLFTHYHIIKITPNLKEFYVLDEMSNEARYFFSYKELIGYMKNDTLLVAINKWSRTTGRHINQLKKMFPNHLQTTQEIIYRESGLDEPTKERILRLIS